MNQYLIKTASANLPTEYGIFQVLVYRSKKDNLEHTVLLRRGKSNTPFLVRIHSSCLTGDIFSSLKCDCRDQLVMSLKKISKAQNGALIYLNQEGRGIGLTNKIKAYALQDKGLNTIQANERLGLAADLRDYSVAAHILNNLKINQVILLTNNPDKISQLNKFGIKVIQNQRVETPPNKINKNYLQTKKNQMGHKLRMV